MATTANDLGPVIRTDHMTDKRKVTTNNREVTTDREVDHETATQIIDET